MSQVTSIRMIRESIEAQSRAARVDEIGLESLRGEIERTVLGVRRAIDRVQDFAARGLISEAASIVEDFPDLIKHAQDIAEFPASSPAVARFWSNSVDIGADRILLPTSEDINLLADVVGQASRLRPLLDALRTAALRREPITTRLAILKKLREADGRNRLWLDQIDALEREWLKRIAEMRTDPHVSYAELEEAGTALATRQWVAAVPRGLREEIEQLLKPMRAQSAGERYAALASEIHAASARMDRAELERLEAAWATVSHDTGHMPPEELQAVVAPGFEWLGRVAAEEREQADFTALVERLERALDDGRPAVEIERALSALRDSGRSAPEGVVARANARIGAERDQTRRRHRLVLVSSLAAAAVLLAAGSLAVSAYSRAQARRGAAATLTAAIEAGDALTARRIAEEIGADPNLATAELAALRARSEELGRRWDEERLALASVLDGLEAALASDPGRARLAQLESELTDAKGRARLDEESRRIERLTQQHADRAMVLDELDARTADDAIARIDAALAEWPLPDRWKPSEQIDPDRWRAYAAVLERMQSLLEGSLREVAGAALQESRLKLRLEGIAGRLGEAQSRQVEVVAARQSLSDKEVGRGVTTEADLILRLDRLVLEHGATLQRMGLLRAYESSQRCAEAWRAIAAWRDEVLPRVELWLKSPASTEFADAALRSVQDHLAGHPASPHRASAEMLVRRLDPSSAVPLWSANRVSAALSDFFYSGLEEVPLRGSERFFYRRAAGSVPNLRQRAVENLEDLQMQPERLNGMLLDPGDEIAGTTRPCAVSDAWMSAERAASVAEEDAVQPLLLALLEKLRGGGPGDPVLRLRALRDATMILQQSGHSPNGASKLLEPWMQQCSIQWSSVLEVDWPLAAYRPPANASALRREADAAIRSFPSLLPLVDQARIERERLRAGMQAIAPIGVLLPADGVSADRVLGDGGLSDPVVVMVVSDGPKWRLSEFAVIDGRIVKQATGLPEGPVLVFRRVGK